jgi:cytosine/adenosine deaminase-related metal-dependent hydrolase
VPLHLHLSEQQAENEACVAATGHTPTRLVHDHGVLGSSTTAVHCTHVDADDIELLGTTGTTVCLCPTTERDLADGVAPAAALALAGCRLRVGTDSHAVVDLFEEVRAIELDQRLVTGRRGLHRSHDLLAAAVGSADDRIAIDLDSVRLAGYDRDDPVPMLVAAATAADITDVIVDGRHVVKDGTHVSIDVAAELRTAIAAVS